MTSWWGTLANLTNTHRELTSWISLGSACSVLVLVLSLIVRGSVKQRRCQHDWKMIIGEGWRVSNYSDWSFHCSKCQSSTNNLSIAAKHFTPEQALEYGGVALRYVSGSLVEAQQKEAA